MKPQIDIETLAKLIAKRLGYDVADIDRKRLALALSHVRQETSAYMQSVYSVGQIPGNIPRSMAIAITYDGSEI